MEKDHIIKRMNMSVLLIEYMSPLLAVVAGLFSFRYFSFFWKMLFFQVALYVLIIKLVYVITPGITTTNNHWFYNGYTIVEIAFLCFAPFVYFKNSFLRPSLFVFYLFYLLVFVAQGLTNGFDHFTHLAFAAAGLIVTVIYGIILFREFQNKKIYWLHSPEIWACIGLLLYFACNVPYFSIFNFLNAHYPKESRFLFNFITDVLANIRYLCLAFAFLLLRKQTSPSGIHTS